MLKLFAKHIKAEDQMKLLSKSVAHIGVGTPGRLSTLIEKGQHTHTLKVPDISYESFYI